MKQHTYALLRQDAFAQLHSNMARPTGDTVAVMDNAGNEVQADVMFGGFVLIGEKPLGGHMWVAVFGCGLDSAFAEFRQTLGAIRSQTGQPVGVELHTWNDAPEGIDFSALDLAVDPTVWWTVNDWLALYGLEIQQPQTIKAMVESVFQFFRSDFAIGRDLI